MGSKTIARELTSPIKHEYVGGVVYAMAGAKNNHSLIAMNTLGSLFGRLRGKKCNTYNSDTKIRLRLPNQTRFYYPDGSVVCRPNDPEDSFQDEPILVLEVLSSSTRRIDLGEKKDAYLSLPSLCVYFLLESTSPTVIVYRRTGDGFVTEFQEGMDSVVQLPEIDAELPFTDVYDSVTFASETEEAPNQPEA